MHGLRSCRDDRAARFRPPAIPGRDDPARLLDDRNQRANVIGLQNRLDDEIDMAGGQQAIGIAIDAVAEELDLVLHGLEALDFPVLE